VIQLTCAQCKNLLEVDDAFAGGVCRCKFCGTIQTVPRPGARPSVPGSASPGGSVAGAESPKALYQVKSRNGSSSAPSGLEELAEVVHSSGLSGSGMMNRSRTVRRTTASPQQQKKSNLITLYAIIGGVCVVVLIVLALVVFNRRSATTLPGNRSVSSADASAYVGAEPAIESTLPSGFAGIDLAGDKVIFLIDRGDATAAHFEVVRKLTLNAVRGLGDSRRFQVILWNNGQNDAYPTLSTALATSAEVEALSRWFDDVIIGQSAELEPAMRQAMTQNPDTLLIVTGKADQLLSIAPDFVNRVLALRAGKTPTIHTVSLGDASEDDPLPKIALETGGKHVVLTSANLSALR
jgi:hypothetical protein